MKKSLTFLFKLLQWCVSILLILFGLLMVIAEFNLSTILMLLSGIIVLPPITQRIPKFKFRRFVLIVIPIVLWIIAIICIPYETNELIDHSNATLEASSNIPNITSQTDLNIDANTNNSSAKVTLEERSEDTLKEVTSQETPSIVQEEKNEKVAEDAPEEEKSPEIPSKESELPTSSSTSPMPSLPENEDNSHTHNDKNIPLLNKSTLKKWIEGYMGADIVYTIDESECNDWRSYQETEFLPIWKEIVYEKISSTEDFQSIKHYVYQAEQLYCCIYPNTENLEDISYWRWGLEHHLSRVETLEFENPVLLNDREKFHKMYLSCEIKNFYITQRLEEVEDDSLLGKLYDTFNKNSSSTESEWVAYDVVYYEWGSSGPGESCYVLHSNELNPFTKAGEYEILFINTGRTKDLVDERGFVFPAPIYDIVSMNTNDNNIIIEYMNEIISLETAYTELQLALGTP